MAYFYFTYGSDHWAGGGWTVVEAEDIDQACDIFSIFHPRRDGFVACCWIYDEKGFQRTSMPEKGNLGMYCVETIRIQRSLAENVRNLAENERYGPDA